MFLHISNIQIAFFIIFFLRNVEKPITIIITHLRNKNRIGKTNYFIEKKITMLRSCEKRVWPRGQMSRLRRLSFDQLGIRTDTLNTPRICAALNPSICVTWNAGQTRTLYVYTILRGCDHERVDYPGLR